MLLRALAASENSLFASLGCNLCHNCARTCARPSLQVPSCLSSGPFPPSSLYSLALLLLGQGFLDSGKPAQLWQLQWDVRAEDSSHSPPPSIALTRCSPVPTRRERERDRGRTEHRHERQSAPSPPLFPCSLRLQQSRARGRARKLKRYSP